MSRRAILAGTAAAGAAWVTPSILVATPSAAATLSTPPGGMTPAGPALERPAASSKPLAFTGDDLERDAGIGAVLVASGWLFTRWQAGEKARSHGA